MLKLLKASAGSGKTFTLAREYICLLFSSETAYRHILAVTFTNKATEEMKSRILYNLSQLAVSPQSSPYYDSVLEAAGGRLKTADQVRDYSRKILECLLNDYASFSVSTIDRFFQRAMRAFAREMGIYSSYGVELDRKALYDEAIDSLIDSLDASRNPELLEWLTEMAIEEITKGNSWNIRDKLKGFGTSIFSEQFRILAKDRRYSEILSRDRISTVRSRCREIRSSYETSLREAASKLMYVMEEVHHLEPSCFKNGSRSAFFKIPKMAYGENFKEDFKAHMALLKFADLQPQEWCSAKSPYKQAIAAAYDDMCPIMLEMKAIMETDGRKYHSAEVIEGSLAVLGVMSDIVSSIESILRERNAVMLDDTNQALSRIINGDDTPFVYEKIGTRYDHYMLDEFQDTSRLQWDNLYPLVADSVSRGMTSLVVGDVKQSIYRWRSSDWRILAGEIAADRILSQGLVQSPLTVNWRSRRNIVDFNCAFFLDVTSRLGNKLLRKVYSDVVQQSSPGNDGGYVTVRFLDKDEQTPISQKMNSTVLGLISELSSRGYAYRDIAVLVRSNSAGASVVNALAGNNVPVISEDSLYLSSSMAVAKVVEVLEGRNIGTDGSLYVLCERIVNESLSSQQIAAEAAYIYSFMDYVNDYVSQHGSDISKFLAWWKSSCESLSIAPPEGRDAVQVMTIHKAKGLDFKAVIVPYFTMPLYTASVSWCEISGDDFGSDMPVPVKLTKTMEQTVFADNLEYEKQMSCIDNVNIAYVAFTRSVDELHVLCEVPNRSDSSGSMASELQKFCTGGPIVAGTGERAVEVGMTFEGGVYSYGSPVQCKLREDFRESGNVNAVISKFIYSPAADRLKLSLEHFDCFSDDSRRVRGTLLHSIMSSIATVADVERAVRNAVYSGDIGEDEFDGTLDYLLMALESVSQYGWFDGTFDIMNECQIILPSGKIVRPDRVMTLGSMAIVVDYKFAEESPAYIRQIREYASVLKNMGYSQVDSYLWYIDSGIVKKY